MLSFLSSGDPQWTLDSRLTRGIGGIEGQEDVDEGERGSVTWYGKAATFFSSNSAFGDDGSICGLVMDL